MSGIEIGGKIVGIRISKTHRLYGAVLETVAGKLATGKTRGVAHGFSWCVMLSEVFAGSFKG